MPTVLETGPYAFRFFSSDHDEPPHVHVARETMEAKFWLDPNVELARNHQFRRHELKRIQALVREHREKLLEEWHDFFDDRQ